MIPIVKAIISTSRGHPPEREWGRPDRCDPERGCGQPEEHLIPGGPAGAGNETP